MRGEIITIGDELLSGRVMNLNGCYASSRLSAMGFEVGSIAAVGDDPIDIANVLKRAMARSDFVIVTGGLGTTEDDITTKTVSEVLKRPLILNQVILDNIKLFLEKRNLPWNDTLEKLALLPEGASLVDPRGRRCGFTVTEKGRPLFFLPGVPEEMQDMMDKCIIPHLMALASHKQYYATRTLKLFNVTEHHIGSDLKGFERTLPGLTVGYYPNFPEVHVVLTVRGDDQQEVQTILSRAEAGAMERIGANVIARDHETLESVVGRLLLEHKMTLALAESCTGGLIGHRITEVSGSSEYFERGFVVYSNRAKVEELNVDPRVLEEFGAVSGQTAEAMAEGVRRVSGASMGLSVTGIAGPTGATPGKPVGTVYIGLATEKGVVSGRNNFSGKRWQVKRLSAHTALDWIRRYFAGDPFFRGI